MAFWLVFDNKVIALTASELSRAGLLGIEVVKARLSG